MFPRPPRLLQALRAPIVIAAAQILPILALIVRSRLTSSGVTMLETGHKLNHVISRLLPPRHPRFLPVIALSASLLSWRTGPVAGSYVADRLDGRPVPAEL